MKKSIFKYGALLGLTALLAACAPGLSTLIDNALGADAIDGAHQPTTAGLTLAYSSQTSNLRNTNSQRIVLNFNQTIDQSTVATGIIFSTLNDSPSNDGTSLYVATTLVPTKIEVLGKSVIATLDLTSSKNMIEIKFDSQILTGANGAARLDTNGNTIRGEVEDTRYIYPTVSAITGGTILSLNTGATRNPQATATVTATNLFSNSAYITQTLFQASTPNTITFTASDTGAGVNPSGFSTANLTAATKAYKNADGAWVETPFTLTYNPTTREASVSITTPAIGATYKIVVNKYEIAESTALLGFIHRASWDKLNTGGSRDLVQIYTITNTGSAGATAPTVSSGGSAGALYVDITTTYPMDLATVNAKSLKVFLSGPTLSDGNTGSAGFYPYTLVPMETSSSVSLSSDAVCNHFRLYLSSTVKSLTGTKTLYLAPTVLSTTDGTTPAQDRRSFGSISIADDAWNKISF